MADLTESGDDRGQLLIVASVGFAIVLIALALALNTAVYSDVHVSQADTGSLEERSATQYQHSVERGIATILPVTGENATESELEGTLKQEVELWENLTKSQYARDGVATNLTLAGVTYQDRIVHDNESRPFESGADTTDWTVASNATDATEYQLTVRNDSLASSDTDAFTLEVVGDSNNNWTLSAYSTASSEIAVDINGSQQYTTDQSSLQVDVATGVFNETGETEQFTSFVDDLDAPYEIQYTNADNVTGTYVLYDDDLTVTDSNYGDVGSPRVDLQIGSATITVDYHSPALRYRNDVLAEVDPDDA